MNFGIIGTGNIVNQFLDAAKAVPSFSPGAVYSRSIEKAGAFAEAHGMNRCYDRIEDLARDRELDAVYIASPNALHCEQAVKMLEHKKHVLCEKPVASNSLELKNMLACADENKVLLMEASRHLFDPGVAVIHETLPALGKLRRVAFTYNQYSSRYGSYKKGIVENAFDPSLSNGALMDIGLYCVELLVFLFGLPSRVQSACVKLPRSIDGQGFVLAEYPDMLAELSYSKISQAYAPSVVQGESGSLFIDDITFPKKMTLQKSGEPPQVIYEAQGSGNMAYELACFIEFAGHKEGAAAYNACSVKSLALMDEIRKQQGITFPADTKYSK